MRTIKSKFISNKEKFDMKYSQVMERKEISNKKTVFPAVDLGI